MPFQILDLCMFFLILDQAVCIIKQYEYPWYGMNPIILLPTMGKS